MIKFKQKTYSKESDAMRALYVALQRERKRVEVIDSSSLIAVLKGNNIVIERFVLFTPTFGKDRFRMYLKIGAKAKMPDNVKLAESYLKSDQLFETQLKLEGGLERRKLFSKNKNKNNNNNNQNQQGPGNFAKAGIDFGKLGVYKTKENRIGEAILYDIKSRSLVLEFGSIENAVRALDILPFGINYKLYLLDS
jgi:hypothetical protein